MSRRTRLLLLAFSLVLLLPGALDLLAAMPAFGTIVSPYGEAVNTLGPSLRHVSNMVSAVNFDFRGIDTLGEECMLLCAVTGAVIVLRGARGERAKDKAGRLPGRVVAARPDAIVLVSRFGAGLLALFGLYIVAHGTSTPGGGFQGGVILASSLAFVYLGEGYGAWRSIAKGPLLAAMEGGGALLFVLAAGLPLLFGLPALTNMLPLGTFRDVLSGGSMLIVNLAVALAVAGGFGMMLLEFMEETREPTTGEDPIDAEEGA